MKKTYAKVNRQTKEIVEYKELENPVRAFNKPFVMLEIQYDERPTYDLNSQDIVQIDVIPDLTAPDESTVITKSWQIVTKTPEIQNRPILEAIKALEEKQQRPIRDYVLGDASALAFIQDINAQIQTLRNQLTTG